MKKTTKYILASSLIAILTITLFGVYALEQYTAYEVSEENERREACIRTFWQLLSDKGTDFRIADGKLLAGNYQVNGNFELPDKVQAIFGGVATVFMGDERVSTNVLNAEGKRAVGTRLVGPAYEAVFKQGKSYRGEAAILGVPYLTAYDPIRDRTGKIIGVLFVGSKKSELMASLTELKMHLTLTLTGMVTVYLMLMVLLGRAMKRAEDANDNQIRFQQTLINTIPSPVFYKDATCRYLGCNKAFEAFVGFTQEELIGKTPHEIWPKELADTYRQQDLALLENPGLQVYETAVRYSDGSLRDVIFYKATFEENKGAVAGLVGVILDITERKTAEDATKNANQQLSEIVEFLPDATFVVDKEKRVIAWNRAMEIMTGLEKREVMGQGDYVYAIPFYGERRPILIDLLGEEQDVISQNYKWIKKEGRTLFTEAFVPSFRNGDSLYFWATATPLFDKQGNQVGAIESIRDITEYRRAEQEKSRLEAQLQQARIMESLLVRLGHDLKTPLTPLFILLPMIKERVADSSLEKMLDICLKNTISIKELTDKARILVKLTLDIMPNELEYIQLSSAVDECLAACADLLAGKVFDCRNEIDPAIVVQVVPAQLQELFANLISNAVRYSPEKGVIRITASQSNEIITVSVIDDGIGLAPDHLEQIFEEFFKVDESRHDLAAAGLGLSICRRIVQNHHGQIWAESPGLGHGTSIHFTLNQKTDDIQHN